MGNIPRNGKGILNTLLNTEKILALKTCVRETRSLKGAMAEVGVYKGGSARIIHEEDPTRDLHLFDTFSGMPQHNPEVDRHHEGDFSDTSFKEVLKYVIDSNTPENVTLWVGEFQNTCQLLPTDMQFSFVHLDADLYKSTKDALGFFWPKLVIGGVILLDDYLWPGCPGVKLAVKEHIESIGITDYRARQITLYQLALRKMK